MHCGRYWYGDPARRLTLVGITGTNGKTTTTALVRHLLNHEGTAGSIGTLGAFDGAGRPVQSTAGSLTTPGPIDLQATLAAMVDRGVRMVAMETSSHSLDQGRLDGLTFAAAVFTNLTRDHLDYHGTMDGLPRRQAQARWLPRPRRVRDRQRRRSGMAGAPARPTPAELRHRREAAQVRAADLVLDHAGSRFQLVTPQGSSPVRLAAAGRVQCVQRARRRRDGTEPRRAARRGLAADLTAAPQVPGRMERIVEKPLHRAPRLRPHARRAGTGAARASSAHPRTVDRGLRLRRRSRPGQATGHGADRGDALRPADRDIGQSPHRRSRRHHRRGGAGDGNGAPHQRYADRRAGDRRGARRRHRAATPCCSPARATRPTRSSGWRRWPFDEREIVRGMCWDA